MLCPVVGDSFTHNGARVVQSLCHRQDFEIALGQIAESVEIIHLTFDVKKGAHRAVLRGGESDDLPWLIYSLRAALVSAQCGKIDRHLVSAQKGVVGGRLGNVSRPRDGSGIIAVGGTTSASEGAEIFHLAVLIEKTMTRAVGEGSGPNHIACGVDAIRCAGGTTEGAQIDNAVTQFRMNPGERDQEEEYCCEAGLT